MRKLLSCLLAFITCVSAWAAASLGDTFTSGYLNYRVTSAATTSARAKCTVTGLSTSGKSMTSLYLFIGGYVTYNGETIDIETVTTRAFENQTNITNVQFAYGMRDIGTYAFSGCTNLTNVRLPSSMLSIQGNAFAGCTMLRYVYFALGNPTGYIFNSSAFPSNSGMTLFVPKTDANSVEKYKAMNAFKKFAYVYKSSDVYDFSMTNGINLIVTQRATSNYSGEVTLVGFNASSSGVTNGKLAAAGAYGFYGYTYKIVSIADSACQLNTGIKALDLSNTTYLKKIGTAAFQSCTNLASINTKANEIGNYAFNTCTSLTSITLGEGVETLGEYSLAYCSSLSTVTLPASLTTTYPNTFNKCTALKSIGVKNGSKTYSSHEGILYSNDDAKLFRCPEGFPYNILVEETFPEKIQVIGEYAFYGCPVSQVYLPYRLTGINTHAFLECTKLNLVKFPSTLKTLDQRAFYNCTSLTDIYAFAYALPTQSYDEVFYNCPKTRLHIGL